MQHIDSFLHNSDLISKYEIGNAHLLWSMGLYLDESDFDRLATDALTDGGGDKKIDFIIQQNNVLYIVQGYYSQKIDMKIKAPANKASDLNTAMAWLVVGDETKVPEKLKIKITEARSLIDDSEIDTIELLYVHNCAESDDVKTELETCKDYLSKYYKDITIVAKELGLSRLEKLYIALSQQIIVKEDITIEGELIKDVTGNGWSSHIGIVKGEWLYDLYHKYGDDLFSANYRGFMGLGRKKINNAIKQTAESSPEDFFVFNNGISILTTKYDNNKLHGMSIINGAQTTGSISSVSDKIKLKDLQVMCKVIVSSDPDKVKKIVEYNNTQNHITTWDHYTNSPEQTLILEEFNVFGYSYSLKRGFDNTASLFGIEVVAQPLVALHGDYVTANRGKNYVFETKTAYDNAFHESKAQHILFAYCLAKAVESVKSDLKNKLGLIEREQKQLDLLQSLKAKHFILSLVGKILDELVGTTINPKLVKFKYNTALIKNYTLDDLVKILKPVISAILPALTNHVGSNFNTYLRGESPLDSAADFLRITLATIRETSPLEALDTFALHIE